MHFQSPIDYARGIGVKMGKGCSISTKEFSSEGYLIELGDYVRVAARASFYTHGGVIPLRTLYNDPNPDIFRQDKDRKLYINRCKLHDYAWCDNR